MSKTLLLISNRLEDQAFATEVAIEAGLSLKQVDGPIAGVKFIQENEVGGVFVDSSSENDYLAFENAVQETLGLFSDKINTNTIHFISAEDLEKTKYLVQSPLFGNFILRNTTLPKENGQHYGRILKATLSERSFGLENFLKPETKIQTVKITVSSQKQNTVEAIKAYLLAAKFQSRMATVIANAVDELLMNAIFDAPVDDMGKPTLISVPRSTEIHLEGQSVVELHIGFDGQYVGISAIDLFGSIDKAKLLGHISKIYDKEEYKVRTSVAGAGIGLATVFRSGGSFFIASESKTKTEVIVFFKKTENFREFKNQFRFISTQFYF